MMTSIKNNLQIKISNEWLNDCLITYIEKDVFDSVSNNAIMYYFHDMKLIKDYCKRILLAILVLLQFYDKKYIYMYFNSILIM